jgi:hypothetical protein
MEEYLLYIKIDSIPAVHHARRTFVLGFLTCMKSINLLVSEMLFRNASPIKYFLTYKLSQDHNELFFSCIRARGGWNNNPSCQQFQAAMRALLLKNSVAPGTNSNVIISDYTSFLHLDFSPCKRKETLTPSSIDPLDDPSNQYFLLSRRSLYLTFRTIFCTIYQVSYAEN